MKSITVDLNRHIPLTIQYLFQYYNLTPKQIDSLQSHPFILKLNALHERIQSQNGKVYLEDQEELNRSTTIKFDFQKKAEKYYQGNTHLYYFQENQFRQTEASLQSNIQGLANYHQGPETIPDNHQKEQQLSSLETELKSLDHEITTLRNEIAKTTPITPEILNPDNLGISPDLIELLERL